MVRIAAAVIGFLLSCSVCLAQGNHGKSPELQMAAKKKSESASTKPFNGREAPDWVYHLSQAKWHSRDLRESTMIKVAHAIEERGWTQAQAAKFLGVSQPRISDLMRGQSHKFTLDTLVEMLYALDKPVTISIDTNPKWNLSSASPVTDKEIEDKIEYYTKSIKLDPSDKKSYYKRADAYNDLKKYDLAIGDLTRCLEIDPNDYSARSLRAFCYSDTNQYKAAIQDCDELIRRFPNDNVYQNRGLIYQKMGEYEKAMADHTRAIEIDPHRPGPHWNRACLNRQLGRIDEARIDFENTLKADPGYQSARTALEELKKKQSG